MLLTSSIFSTLTQARIQRGFGTGQPVWEPIFLTKNLKVILSEPSPIVRINKNDKNNKNDKPKIKMIST